MRQPRFISLPLLVLALLSACNQTSQPAPEAAPLNVTDSAQIVSAAAPAPGALRSLAATPTVVPEPTCIPYATRTAHMVHISGFAGDSQVTFEMLRLGKQSILTTDLSLTDGATSVGLESFLSAYYIVRATGKQTGQTAQAKLYVPCDFDPPSVTINQASGQTDPTLGSPINFTAVFSEAVTGFGGSDVTLEGTAGATTAAVTETAPNNGTTYNVAVSGMTASGTVLASVAADRAVDAGDNGNSASTSTDNTVTFVVDMSPPVITISTPVEGTSYLLNATVAASYSCDDGDGSGVASCVGTVPNGSAVDTSSVGTKTFTVTATDKKGNESSKSVSYKVSYVFSGFSSPVDNLPTLNSAKAGQAIPLKWRLIDANGTPVTNLTSAQVGVSSLSCLTSTGSDAIEEYATSTSGLQNLGNGLYQFNWKTPKSYAGSCKTLLLDLGDGLKRTAAFGFR